MDERLRTDDSGIGGERTEGLLFGIPLPAYVGEVKANPVATEKPGSKESANELAQDSASDLARE